MAKHRAEPYLRMQFGNLPTPAPGFGGGGKSVMSLNSPYGMRKNMKQEGLSVRL